VDASVTAAMRHAIKLARAPRFAPRTAAFAATAAGGGG
jgi:hypothetical protein